MSFAYGWLPGDEIGYGSPASAEALSALQSLGVEWIAIIPYGSMESAEASEVRWGGRGVLESDDKLRAVTAQARSAGLKVMLKPHLWLRAPAWSGDVSPRDPAAWFRSYERFIVHYATLAEELGVEALCIGNELEKTSRHEQEWRAIIQRVRETYRGTLTYGANGEEVFTVPFWDDLDVIGLSGYFPLVEGSSPSRASLVGAWSPYVKRLSALSRRWGRKVVFTELGYRSADFAAWKHWEIADDAPINLQLQADAYAAFFEAVWSEPWCGGVFWWKWMSYPEHSSPRNNQYELENKPAAEVVRAFYAAPD